MMLCDLCFYKKMINIWNIMSLTKIHVTVSKKQVQKQSQNRTSGKNFIEVCSGCGGLSTGLINAGFSPILLNDNDRYCCDSLKKNHPNIPIDTGSILDLDLSSYKDIDLLAGGVPCQSFSQAGKRKGLDDKRGQLLPHFNELVRQCQPKVFLIENVKGLTTHNKGVTLKDIITLLESDGKYQVQYKVLNSNDYGVPQKRERLFVIGIRKGLKNTFVYPTSHSYKPVLKDVLMNVPPSDGYKYPDKKKEVLDLVPPGGCWVNLPEDIQKSYMGASYNSGGGKRGIARRLSMNEASLTLTTSPMQKQTERCHPLETRPFTVREYARIQTFPDSYIFAGSVAQQYKQIGNAVPVKLAEAVGGSIMDFLNH
jgi:DNA (cytosine-5)-methyltransferase 1